MKSTDLRIQRHPLSGLHDTDRRRVLITVDGETLEAVEGESLAAALWAGGRSCVRHDESTGAPRGMYCGIGHCYECRATVDGIPDVRTCLTPVRDGMRVSLAGKRAPGDER